MAPTNGWEGAAPGVCEGSLHQDITDPSNFVGDAGDISSVPVSLTEPRSSPPPLAGFAAAAAALALVAAAALAASWPSGLNPEP